MPDPFLRIAWAAYEHDNAVANAEYERVRLEGDNPIMCGKRLHEMAPGNIRFDRLGRRHCRQCERDRRARKKRENDSTD